MEKSEIVGWSLGSKLEVIAISEHLRKMKQPIKHGIKGTSGMD